MADEEWSVDMDEPNGAPPATTSTWNYCSWHRGVSSSARLVQIIEQGSGTGVALYACAPCREVHHLTLVVDQP